MTDFAAMWTGDFRQRLKRKRATIERSRASLQKQDSSYYAGHVALIEMLDKCLGAIEAAPVEPKDKTP